MLESDRVLAALLIADTLVTDLSMKLVEHLEHTLHLESYIEKGSGLVLKKNDAEICKTS